MHTLKIHAIFFNAKGQFFLFLPHFFSGGRKIWTKTTHFASKRSLQKHFNPARNHKKNRKFPPGFYYYYI
jgi:hypothetical protein